MKEKDQKLFYGWWILLVCILINVTTHVLNFQMGALYLKPIVTQFGIARSLFSLQSVVMVISSVISAPILGKMYKKYDTRVVLGLCTLVTGLQFLGKSAAPNIYVLLVLSFINGVSLTGSTALPISILLTSWFVKKRGLVISIASVGISLGGVVFSPIVERMISTYGWRVSYGVSGLIILATLPVILAVIRKSPSEKGLKPLGAGEAIAVKTKGSADGFTMKEAAASPILYIFLIGIFCMTICTGASLQLAAYLTDIGYSGATAAKVMSSYMAVGIVSKLVLGQLIDKWGEKKAAMTVCSIGAASYLCLLGARNPVMLCLVILFYGVSTSITSVLPSLVTSRIFGTKDYSQIYGTVLSINRLGGAVGTFVLSLMFDLTGNYNVVWPGCAILMMISLLSILYCLRQAALRKEKAQLSPAAEQPQAAMR